MAARPEWFDDRLFPYESRFAEVDGAAVHYVDEGEGPVLLMLHGQPTWSFVYRHLIAGLRDRFRCVALDYPGFGLSTAPPSYGYRAADHARVVESFVDRLEIDDITLMVQDWGGPIGLSVAVRRPRAFRAFVIGNTWGWPVTGDRGKEVFSRILGSGIPGAFLVRNFDIFTKVFLQLGMRRKRLSTEERRMYEMPHPTPESRASVHVLPREILAAHALLEEVERGLAKLAERPALIVWGDRDVAFRRADLRRWERTFEKHRTVMLRGAGHFIQEDAPEEIVMAIRAWWPGDRPGSDVHEPGDASAG